MGSAIRSLQFLLTPVIKTGGRGANLAFSRLDRRFECRCLLLSILAGQSLLGAQPVGISYACEAPAEIQAAINRASRGGIEALLTKFPGDFWVQRSYILAMGAEPAMPMQYTGGMPGSRVDEAVIERFKRNYDAQPDDPEAAYLYAHSLIHRDTNKAIEILTSVTQKTPSFPTAWVTLAILHGYPNFSDRAKQRVYVERYLERCPDTTDFRVVSLAVDPDKSDTLVAYTRNLRERIAGKADTQTLPLYFFLWRLESKVTPGAGQPQFQKKVEEDLRFLEGLSRTRFGALDSLLRQGYTLTGNQEAQQRLSTPTAQPSRPSAQSFSQAQYEWLRANPLPPPTGGSATRVAYYRRQLQFLDEWQAKLPDAPAIVTARFSTLSSIPDTPDEVLLREGQRLLDVMRKLSSGVDASSSMEVARVWAQRGLELDRVTALVKEASAAQEKSLARPGPAQQSDLYSGPYEELMQESRRWPTKTSAWSILVTAFSKARRFTQARAVLADWEAALDERRRRADEIRTRRTAEMREASAAGRSSPASSLVRGMEDALAGSISNDDSKYYEALAQLADGEGRKLDALTFYQTSFRVMYGRYAAPPNLMDLDAGEQAGRIWKELGGTEPAWQAWLESIRTVPMPRPAAAPQASSVSRAIPDFKLSDQNGKTWTLASLKGKATLISVWATWCGPCREELPHLQKLYEQVKNRDDIQVITLNVDEDLSLVEPFLGSYPKSVMRVEGL
jgi:thiol-disulfide isomerase/thioredoxin